MKDPDGKRVDFHPYGTSLMRNPPSKTQSRPLLTIKVGAMTQWIRDILAIILMWKLIAAI